MKNRNGGNGHNPQGKFLLDTQHMLERLRPELAATTAKRQANERMLGDLGRRRANLLAAHVDALLPDLSARTVSKLKVFCTSFVTNAVQASINATHTVEVPFWTWIFGGGPAYKQDVAATTLTQLRVQLKAWLDRQNPKPDFMRDVGAVDKQINVLNEQQRTLAETEGKLSPQVEQLERVHATYSRTNAPEPPTNLRDAVSNSADRMRAAPPSSSSSTNTVVVHDSGPSIVDYLILNSILNSGHHNDDSYRGGGGRDKPSSSGSYWSDGSPRDTSRDHDTGGGSTRLAPDDSAQDGGGGSTRIFAAANEGGGGSDRLGAFS